MEEVYSPGQMRVANAFLTYDASLVEKHVINPLLKRLRRAGSDPTQVFAMQLYRNAARSDFFETEKTRAYTFIGLGAKARELGREHKSHGYLARTVRRLLLDEARHGDEMAQTIQFTLERVMESAEPYLADSRINRLFENKQAHDAALLNAFDQHEDGLRFFADVDRYRLKNVSWAMPMLQALQGSIDTQQDPAYTLRGIRASTLAVDTLLQKIGAWRANWLADYHLPCEPNGDIAALIDESKGFNTQRTKNLDSI